jgi:hypothetical protein
MINNYSTPDLLVLRLSAERVLCLSVRGLDGFRGPDNLEDPYDPYNYQW